MKRVSESNSVFPLYIIVFAIGIIMVFGITEFRFLRNILTSYENSIEQIAINKTNSFLNDLKTTSQNTARSIELQDLSGEKAVKTALTYDHKIENVYLVSDSNITNSSAEQSANQGHVFTLAAKALKSGNNKAVLSDQIHSQLNIISTATVINNSQVLVMDFRMDQYKKEVIEEFTSTNFKLAVFDSQNNPVIWPFEENQLSDFNRYKSKLSVDNKQYKVKKSDVGQPSWQLYLFQKDNNFEKYRAVTIIALVFALYYVLYQLLVEFWGVNSAKTYFDNIDFAIFNQLHEGVIITNNAGIIVFANKAAHEIFTERKSNLRNVKLKEVMGHIENFQGQKDNSQTLTLKTSDKFLEAIHSPIIKKSKRLGSLTVIRVNTDEDKAYRNVMEKLVEIIPQGVVYVDKNNEIVTANLMAKCFLGALEQGKGIEVVDSTLAESIRTNINSRNINRIKLPDHDIWCDISPVYDNDGVYTGTLLMLLNIDSKA
ncbi:MAG: PAS domain-containing protein [Firmicutes bacterium]|nr:PAS domain-containing protein [Bacillota bacterium]